MSNRVTVDVLVDQERGFRQRITGEIKWRGDVSGTDFVILKNVSVYAYHPANPDGGRDIPARNEYLCEASELRDAG